jgi:phosphoglycerate dehydrogenase-like enzyme
MPRGGLIDENALLEAIISGKLHGVGLDVFPDEPNINPEFFKHPNVTLLPHMGTEWVPISRTNDPALTCRTWDSRNKMALMVLDNILAVLKGESLPNIVPEHR